MFKRPAIQVSGIAVPARNSLAQAALPRSPSRLNPRRMTFDLTPPDSELIPCARFPPVLRWHQT
jgi:hypothetical protein